MSPRPEVVLPPGFALRIDYDPGSSPASLLITAYLDDAPVGQAHVDPRDVGKRLRLEVEDDGEHVMAAHAPRLRLTPERGLRAIEMEVVREPAPPRLLLPRLVNSDSDEATKPAAEGAPPHPEPVHSHPGLAALSELAREGSLHYADVLPDDDGRRPLNAVVWLAHGGAVVLPVASPKSPFVSLAARVAREIREEAASDERPWPRFQRAWRALSGVAAELVASPLRLSEADEGLSS